MQIRAPSAEMRGRGGLALDPDRGWTRLKRAVFPIGSSAAVASSLREGGLPVGAGFRAVQSGDGAERVRAVCTG